MPLYRCLDSCRFGQRGLCLCPLADRSDRGREGYTLLELAVVTAIIAVVLFVSFPKFESAYHSRDIKKAARQLVACIRYAHNIAIATGMEHRLFFDIDNGLYWVAFVNVDGKVMEDDSDIGRKRKLFGNVSFEGMISPRIGKVQKGKAYISFSPMGLVDRGQIHIKDSDGLKYTLMVDPLTANVTVYDEYVEEEWSGP